VPRWTEQTKQKQRDRILHQRPWLESTGPRSDYGRLVSSQNATKKHRRRQSEPHPNQQSEIDRKLEIGDRVKYTGLDPAITSIGGGKTLEVFAIRESWAICWVTGVVGLISVRVEDLKNATLG
jgi:hypothetical protein